MAKSGEEYVYYTITLTKSSVVQEFQIRNLRLSGMPLKSLHSLIGPGRLDFTALSKSHPGSRIQQIAACLRGEGVQMNVWVGKYRTLRGRPYDATVTGRITGIAADPASQETNRDALELEQVTFTFEKIQ
jgi:hypothetical protein